tara:strand:- start:587 stop:766 length:180 start_codon:yes stop_codon:yes gene_type:complete
MKLKETKTKFLKIKCSKCKNEQIIFERSATDINCLVCKEQLAKSTGGKAKLRSKATELN